MPGPRTLVEISVCGLRSMRSRLCGNRRSCGGGGGERRRAAEAAASGVERRRAAAQAAGGGGRQEHPGCPGSTAYDLLPVRIRSMYRPGPNKSPAFQKVKPTTQGSQKHLNPFRAQLAYLSTPKSFEHPTDFMHPMVSMYSKEPIETIESMGSYPTT